MVCAGVSDVKFAYVVTRRLFEVSEVDAEEVDAEEEEEEEAEKAEEAEDAEEEVEEADDEEAAVEVVDDDEADDEESGICSSVATDADSLNVTCRDRNIQSQF